MCDIADCCFRGDKFCVKWCLNLEAAALGHVAELFFVCTCLNVLSHACVEILLWEFRSETGFR